MQSISERQAFHVRRMLVPARSANIAFENAKTVGIAVDKCKDGKSAQSQESHVKGLRRFLLGPCIRDQTCKLNGRKVRIAFALACMSASDRERFLHSYRD